MSIFVKENKFLVKADKKYSISYKSLCEKLLKDKSPDKLLISIREKVLTDEIIKIIGEKFVGKNYAPRNNLISFNGDDKVIESILNECSNTGLFSEKKVVVIRNVKKLLKDEKLALIDYINRSNPDTCLVMITADEEFNPGKIFLYDSKDDTEKAKKNRTIIESNVKIFEVEEFSDADTMAWIRDKFEEYKIDDITIRHLLQFSNYSFDEILSEIEKLKTYCYQTKEITIDSVNLCNGIAKDFNEMDFVGAVMERNSEKALMIYERISLKKDVEVYLIFLLASAFTIVNKLYDPAVKGLSGFPLKRELKLWFPDQEKLLPLYKNYRNTTAPENVVSAFNYIYQTDKILKTSGGEKKTIITSLINNICNL